MQIRRVLRSFAGMAQVRAWTAFAFLCAANSTAIAQSLADEKSQESLLASTWKGDILGIPFVGYFLDENLLVALASDQKPRFEQWRIVNGKFSASARLSESINIALHGEVRGDVILGTTYDTLGRASHTAAFELKKQPGPDSRLLAAAPPGRPYPAPPFTGAAHFAGTYEITLPDRGKDGRPLKATLSCRGEVCTFSMGDISEVYDKLDPIYRSHFRQAKFALNYAKERKANAKQEAPYLAALLDSDAGIHSCINLGYKNPRFPGADTPGLTILCRLDHSPWNKPVVLHMGSILSNCGTSFCRYGMLPMFRQAVAARQDVSAARYIGSWEYKEQGSAFRLVLDRDGTCTVVMGGKGSRCRYSERNGTICIDEISDSRGNGLPERVNCGAKFLYESKTDTISMQGEPAIRLARAATRPARP